MLKLKTTILSTKTKMDRNGKNEEVPLNTSINKLMRQMYNGEGRATEQSKYYKNWLCHSKNGLLDEFILNKVTVKHRILETTEIHNHVRRFDWNLHFRDFNLVI